MSLGETNYAKKLLRLELQRQCPTESATRSEFRHDIWQNFFFQAWHFCLWLGVPPTMSFHHFTSEATSGLLCCDINTKTCPESGLPCPFTAASNTLAVTPALFIFAVSGGLFNTPLKGMGLNFLGGNFCGAMIQIASLNFIWYKLLLGIAWRLWPWIRFALMGW